MLMDGSVEFFIVFLGTVLVFFNFKYCFSCVCLFEINQVVVLQCYWGWVESYWVTSTLTNLELNPEGE